MSKTIAAVTFLLAMLVAGCVHVTNQVRTPIADSGKARFETYCAGCHLNEGPYMMGEAPPLEGSSWVAGPENRVIKIVLHGLHGSIEVRGKTYNQELPGFAPILSDGDIAALLSYARGRFGGDVEDVAFHLIEAGDDVARDQPRRPVFVTQAVI